MAARTHKMPTENIPAYIEEDDTEVYVYEVPDKVRYQDFGEPIL